MRLNPILSPPLQQTQTSSQTSQTKETQSGSFQEILSGEISNQDTVKFSKHAQTRLESRNIELGADDLKKLGGAVDVASQKGVQDSLIVMNGLAFIVSVRDRTVVTAMPMDEASSNVFTNIDGAVIA
jgi:flagellar operon protein